MRVLPLLDSIVVSIPACHAGDRGSIPRRGAFCDLGWPRFTRCLQQRFRGRFASSLWEANFMTFLIPDPSRLQDQCHPQNKILVRIRTSSFSIEAAYAIQTCAWKQKKNKNKNKNNNVHKSSTIILIKYVYLFTITELLENRKRNRWYWGGIKPRNSGQPRSQKLPDGESNPGLPRDRRGYSPLYYRGVLRLLQNRLLEKACAKV